MEHPDIDFLMKQPIGDILKKGLAQTYRNKPQFPVDYLAKWLINFDQSNA